MKTILALALVAVLAFPVLAKEKGGKEVSINGEIIDIKCYSTITGGHGADHEECALNCIKGGLPVGLLQDKTNKVYLVVPAKGMKGANEELTPFVAKKVTLKGKIVEKGGQKTFLYSSVELAK